MKTLRVALLASVCLIGPAMAQSMNIDLSKLPPEVAASIIKAEQERKGGIQLPSTVEQAEQYAKIGEQVSKAVAATAKGLSIEVNEFVKTPVGWWTFIFVFWYFLGAKLWHIVGGILFWIASTTIIWKSMKYFFMEHKVLVSQDGKQKKYESKSYEWESRDAKTGVAWAHGLAFAMVTVASVFLVF